MVTTYPSGSTSVPIDPHVIVARHPLQRIPNT